MTEITAAGVEGAPASVSETGASVLAPDPATRTLPLSRDRRAADAEFAPQRGCSDYGRVGMSSETVTASGQDDRGKYDHCGQPPSAQVMYQQHSGITGLCAL